MDEHRPTLMSEFDIPAEVAAIRETEDVYRLYRPEWVIVHTITGRGEYAEPFVKECFDFFDRTYGGRVERQDVDIVATTNLVDSFWVHLKMRKPNMKGEFKQAFLAQRHAEKQGWPDYEIVARNSKRDHELRSFGTKKLS